MQCEQAYPAGDVQHVLVGVISLHSDLVRNIVNDDNAVEENQRYKDEQRQGDVFEHADPLRFDLWYRMTTDEAS